MGRNEYLASILLYSGSFEAELNEAILGALRGSPSVSEMSAPGVLPGPSNRAYFIDRFLSQLSGLPFSVEIITPEHDFQEQVDGYEEGRPDPVHPGGTWSAMSLDVRLELGGKRDAKLFLRESLSEQLVLVTFAFDSSTIAGGSWHKDRGTGQGSDLPLFRQFLLSLTDAFHAISGALGLDLTAATGGLPDDAFRLEDGMWLHRLNAEIRQAGHETGYDFIIVNGAPWGWDRPFVCDGIEPRKFAPGIDAGRKYYDLRLVEEIRANADRAEEAYSRMYESKRPKDERDDALSFLLKSIRLAADMGLEKELARLKERYAHIDAVFHSQFRM
jgi:hypothetical protein